MKSEDFDLEYEKKLDEVCLKYAHDLEDQIEEHYPKGFFIDEDIKGEFEGVLSEMYREIKPQKKEKDSPVMKEKVRQKPFINCFGVKIK